MSKLYTADTHFGHANIIKYCRRPFASVETMDDVLAHNLIEAAKTGAQIIHAGDVSFNFQKFTREHGNLWTDKKHHVVVLGNHDDIAGHKKLAYLSHFGVIVGDPKLWRKNSYMLFDKLDGQAVQVLVSHNPVDADKLPKGWVNVHGHIHNNNTLGRVSKESGWTLDSPVHFNAGVELHGYKPVTLQELANEHRRGYSTSRANALEDGSEFGVADGHPSE